MSVPDKINALLSSPDQIEELIKLIGSKPKDVERFLAEKNSAHDFAPLVALLDSQLGPARQNSLENFVHDRLEPCLRINSSGRILAANAAAEAMLSAAPQQPVDDLEIWPVSGEPLSAQINALFGADRKQTRYSASRANARQFDRPVPYVLVVIPKGGKQTQDEVLMLLGDGPADASRHVQKFRQHDLSPSEVEVVQEFLKGRTLNEIATARGRSLATVRKQFYTICEKFGVTSQAELMRAIYQDARIVADVRPVIDSTERPDRIEAQILRPGGRVVEVIVAGDPNGYPIVLIPSPSLRTWPAATEELFRENGVQCVTIVGPGFGKTSPSPPDMKTRECASADLIAVLDQLGLKRATLLTANFGMRPAIRYAKEAGDRIAAIIVQAPSLPNVEMVASKSRIKILTSLQKVLRKGVRLSDLAVLIAGRSFQAMDPAEAVRLIHRGSPDAIASFLSPENYPDVEGAVLSLFAQGTQTATHGFKSAQYDWSDLITQCEVPITMIGGVDSDIHKLSDIRAFAERFPDHITFHDVSDRGFATPYDMPAYLLSLLPDRRRR